MFFCLVTVFFFFFSSSSFISLLLLSLVHFCTYKEKFISLYCRLSSVLDLDALITQQALREAITDSEVATAKQRHQLILDYIQVRDEHAGEGRHSTCLTKAFALPQRDLAVFGKAAPVVVCRSLNGLISGP